MTFTVTHSPSGDAFEIEADTIEAIQLRVYIELSSRGWNKDDCFSEQIC